MKNKFESFKERVIHLRNLCEGELVEYKNKVAETDLYNLTYNIKWGFEDLVRQEFLYKKYSELAAPMEDPECDWKENILRWMEEDVERNQQQVNRLALFTSTGVMHNTFGLFELQAQAQWVEELKQMIRLLKREDKS
jgi:hypothetical protein